MKKLTVIAYDISSNKRRKKVADLLTQYGQRANNSVFECFINQTETNAIKKQIQEIINPRTDTIFIYTLCKNCLQNKQHFGYATITYTTIEKV